MRVLIGTDTSEYGWPHRDWAKRTKGPKDVVITEFLQARDIDAVRFNRLNKNRMLRCQVDVCTDIPNENIDGFGFTKADAW